MMRTEFYCIIFKLRNQFNQKKDTNMTMKVMITLDNEDEKRPFHSNMLLLLFLQSKTASSEL